MNHTLPVCLVQRSPGCKTLQYKGPTCEITHTSGISVWLAKRTDCEDSAFPVLLPSQPDLERTTDQHPASCRLCIGGLLCLQLRRNFIGRGPTGQPEEQLAFPDCLNLGGGGWGWGEGGGGCLNLLTGMIPDCDSQLS